MSEPAYLKRHRMEVDLRPALPEPELPAGVAWRAWTPAWLDWHALAKARCFAGEPDTLIFPSLGSRDGCRNLMRVISQRDEFCPEATWLLVAADAPLGTVQGLTDERRHGAIQNLGVVPGARRRGLGEALLLQALRGFQACGLRRAYLEVTAANTMAVRLYRKYGFRCTRTFYKAVLCDAAAPEPARPAVPLPMA